MRFAKIIGFLIFALEVLATVILAFGRNLTIILLEKILYAVRRQEDFRGRFFHARAVVALSNTTCPDVS